MQTRDGIEGYVMTISDNARCQSWTSPWTPGSRGDATESVRTLIRLIEGGDERTSDE